MNRQLYAIGQTVSVAPRSLSGPQTASHFQVVGRYPIENRRPMYHLRSLSDRGERMVPEAELSFSVPDGFDRPDRPSKVVRLFPDVVPFERRVTV